MQQSILWVSNSSNVTSGFGNQTALWTTMLQVSGYRVAEFGIGAGILGRPQQDERGIILLPIVNDGWGNDVVRAHAEWFGPDRVITLMDPHVLQPEVYQGLPWIAWAPIDCQPAMPTTVRSLKAARRIWAMSKFGERVLIEAGFDPAIIDYVPHGIDCDLFKPGDQQQARAFLGEAVGRDDLADKFIFIMNSANNGSPGRKGWYEAFAAFKRFSDRHPEAVLYAHTRDNGNGAVDLELVRQMVGLDKHKIVYAPQYYYKASMIGPDFLVRAYQAADALLQPSHGEGFGIPIVEAQACGLPVICTNGTAMTELTLTGWLVDGRPFMHVPGALQILPDIDHLVACMEAAYSRISEPSAVRERILDYDYRRVWVNHMLPALQRAFDRETATPLPGTNSEKEAVHAGDAALAGK